MLREEAASRFDVGSGLTRYDDASTQRAVLSLVKGWYQRDIALGLVTAGYAGGSYGRSLESFIDRIRGAGFDVASVVCKGAVLLLIGEKQNIRVAALACGIIDTAALRVASSQAV